MPRTTISTSAKRSARSGRGVEGRPGRRYEMTDDGYARIADLLPTQQRGGKWNEHRTVINGIFWVLNSGAHWRDMPERYGKWQTGSVRSHSRLRSDTQRVPWRPPHHRR